MRSLMSATSPDEDTSRVAQTQTRGTTGGFLSGEQKRSWRLGKRAGV